MVFPSPGFAPPGLERLQVEKLGASLLDSGSPGFESRRCSFCFHRAVRLGPDLWLHCSYFGRLSKEVRKPGPAALRGRSTRKGESAPRAQVLMISVLFLALTAMQRVVCRPWLAALESCSLGSF